ncbi:hypothetical protein CHS0354_016068, partial [Potamilus streckersoni]
MARLATTPAHATSKKNTPYHVEHQVGAYAIVTVDGGLSEWSNWRNLSLCNATCGGGVKSIVRSRSCTNPTPQNGGIDCNGTLIESSFDECNQQPCPPVDGGLSEWSNWRNLSLCNATCGGGVKSIVRSRSCTNPTPQNGGIDCNGTLIESSFDECNQQPCPPVDGRWSDWSTWQNLSSCNVTCGGGVKSIARSRSCTNPTPQNGGSECNGTLIESSFDECNQQSCPPVDGGLSEWSNWRNLSLCNATCGGGVKSIGRSRSCTNPTPQYGGIDCNGTLIETSFDECNQQPCPP